MTDDRSRLIFLVGCARSGTTLLQNMMDCHPDVVGGPEFLHIPDILAVRTKLLDSVRRGWIDLFCSAEDVDRHFRSLIESLLLPFADRHSAAFLSEKSPQNILVLGDLVELFPQTRCVWILRDPRAVIASLLATGERARGKGERPAPWTADLQSATDYTRRCIRAGFKALAAAPDRIHTVAYERLVRAPEHETRRICEFLGLPWSPEMLSPAAKKHLGEAAITVNSKEIWYDLDTYYSNPNDARVEAWRAELRPYQQRLVNQVFRSFPALTEFGYDFTDARESVSERTIAALRSTLTRAGWKLRRGLRQAIAR